MRTGANRGRFLYLELFWTDQLYVCKQDMDVHVMLPSPCGWPVRVSIASGRRLIVPGIPAFSTCMFVDLQVPFA